MKITPKGQVTIPIDIREKAGLLPGTKVEVLFDGTGVRIVKAKARTGPCRGEDVVQRLRGSATVAMSTDEILGLMRGT